MEFITGNEAAERSIGTSLQGYIYNVSRAEIEAAFGTPFMYEEGDKVTTEWVIEFADGEAATIYDWKRYDDGAPEMNEVLDQWNIGGNNKVVVERIQNMVAKAAKVHA